MRITNRLRFGAGAVMLVGAACLLNLNLARAQGVSETQKEGDYTFTLKILPAEAFTGPNATMERESGAEPNLLVSPTHPNHHMVVFITQNGKVLEDANVEIRYRHLGLKSGPWMNLPVVRMYEIGKGPETTHYGNNLTLNAGTYQVDVTIGRNPPVTFHVTVKS